LASEVSFITAVIIIKATANTKRKKSYKNHSISNYKNKRVTANSEFKKCKCTGFIRNCKGFKLKFLLYLLRLGIDLSHFQEFAKRWLKFYQKSKKQLNS